jgi:ribosome recycling factor
MEKTSEISRDELESLESKIQKATDSHIANIETIVIEKNKDILSI